MFYALTKDVEESFFADNMSVFIAMAPCIYVPTPYGTYENYINTGW